MLKLQKISEFAIVPKRSNPGDSGLDLYSVEDCTIPPHETRAVGTGWKMSVPIGYEIQIRSRSGLALKEQIAVGNAPGTCDATFRGEVKVILVNHSPHEFKIGKGFKMAQMVVAPVILWEPEIVDSLDETARGENGFGSTGVK